MSDVKEKVIDIKDKLVDKGKEALDNLTKTVNNAYNAVSDVQEAFNDEYYDVKKSILEKIKEYDTIIIHRHIRPDGDAIGSSHGLKTIIKESFPKKKVYVASEDKSEYLDWLAKDDYVTEDMYQDALVIVVDTGELRRVSGKFVSKGKEIIKIDHHETSEDYGVINYCIPTTASCANIIADFAFTFRMVLKLTNVAATYLYAGIVTDSGRFRYSSANSTCLRQAAKLLEYGIDTENLYTKLYVDDEKKFALNKYLYANYKISENGVAYIYFKDSICKKYNVSKEDVSAMINTLDSIKGSMIWILFNEGKEATRVRIRSRYINITGLAQKYGGGGHENACGASVKNKKEVKALIKDADQLLKEFKAEHKDLY